MQARIPDNEATRLTALESYHILDTLPEQAFDDITYLAAQICDVPKALITLIDRDRQWFKSRIGFDLSETSRDISFCAYTLLAPQDLLIVPDASVDVRFMDNPLVRDDPKIRFYAGAPLVSKEGAALGTLCVIDSIPRTLSEDQQHALIALSRQVMTQMELRQRVLQSHTSEERFHMFMDRSPALAFMKDARGCYTYVNQPFLDYFQLRLNDIIGKNDTQLWPDQTVHIFQEHTASVLTKNKPISAIEAIPTEDGQTRYWQVYTFVLTSEGQRMLAGMALDITETKYYEEQLEEYQQQLEQLLTQLESQSLTDALTGLKNRRAFQTQLEEEFTRATRYNTPLALLLIDVDHFKQFNDTFGHPAGDAALQQVAKLLGGKARSTDGVARYGGEEFVVILPNTTNEGAYILAERFRRAIQTMTLQQGAITISIGAAALSVATPTAETLVRAADVALYTAKQRGRNRVSIAGEQQP